MRHVQSPLPVPSGTQAVLFASPEPPARLLIFVHGWGGHVMKTWDWHHSWLHSTTAVPDAFDALWYGFDSRRRSASESTENLAHFIGAFMADPNKGLATALGSLATKRATDYRSIVIFCHSLGAPVVRAALIRLWHSRPEAGSWLAKVRLVLFAPAHSGAKVIDTLGTLASLFRASGPVLKLSTLLSPSLKDLESGSAFLKSLASETDALYNAQACPRSALIPASIYWAPNDPIVFNRPFYLKDPVAIQVDDTTHESICKSTTPGDKTWTLVLENIQ